MSPNRAERREKYRIVGTQVTSQGERDREWRVALGQSPNPWGGDFSLGYRVMQIISRHKLSKLEQRTLLIIEELEPKVAPDNGETTAK